MWNRTKRLINSYLDNLIDRAEQPDSEVREVTRAELTRLNEVEISHRANAKVLQKQIAELDLKITGLAERDRILQRQGVAGSSSTSSQLSAFEEQRAMLMKQLNEANSAAERAKALRMARVSQGDELASQTHLTSMTENIANVQSGFGVNDPAGVIDEMRDRIARRGGALTSDAQNLAADADRELAREQKRASVEDMLSRYKQSLDSSDPDTAPLTNRPEPIQTGGAGQPASAAQSGSQGQSQDETQSAQGKSLGRADGPLRPID